MYKDIFHNRQVRADHSCLAADIIPDRSRNTISVMVLFVYWYILKYITHTHIYANTKIYTHTCVYVYIHICAHMHIFMFVVFMSLLNRLQFRGPSTKPKSYVSRTVFGTWTTPLWSTFSAWSLALLTLKCVILIFSPNFDFCSCKPVFLPQIPSKHRQ